MEKAKTMPGLLIRLIFAIALLAPFPAGADPSDIDAAARGVVRVIIVEINGREVTPISHGTGFAVTPERIVTNAHLIEEVRADPNLAIGLVPSDGKEAVYGRLVSVSTRNDLALIATTKPMNLPPLTIAGNSPTDSGQVISVGYPMNVDMAQGLSINDMLRAQPPVKASGALAGRRPSREFDTLLHTAPIARGNSGGPLLDPCGRVLGVNSFGAGGGGADAEFYFAISTRELLPFLRANGVTPQINATPCRSLADLDADERARAGVEADAAQAKVLAQEAAFARRRDEAQREIDFAILSERENGLALAFILLLVATVGGGFAWLRHEAGNREKAKIAGGVALASLAGALVVWFVRPPMAEADNRLQDILREEMSAEDSGAILSPSQPTGELVCTLQQERSRFTGAAEPTIPLRWSEDGCVNGRTQYGADGGSWSRVLVPNTQAAVSVNRFDPATGEYRMERYLLSHDDMETARKARSEYQAPACAADAGAAEEFGAQQASVLSLLPAQPNERLVYRCTAAASE